MLRSSALGARCASILLVLVMLLPLRVAAQTVQTFNASGTWTAPAGVTSVLVVAWGGGGGGASNGLQGGGGGGGGAYASATVTVVPGTTYAITVGSGGGAGIAGGVSQFDTGAVVKAVGGSPGSGNSGGAGGANGASVGTIKKSGGQGGQGQQGGNSSRGGGGGGGSATASADGGQGSAASGATGGSGGTGAGAGGNGGNSGNNGQTGIAPGGGGGGAGNSATGGAGAAGRVTLTYVSLVAEYRFDECSWTSGSAGAVTDSAGSYSGTPYNVSTATGGVVQRAANLTASGTGDYIQWPIGLMNGRNDFTITLWFKTTANQAQQEIFQGLGSTVGNDQIEIYLVNTNRIVVNILDSADLTYTSGTTLNDGAWHHLAVSRSGANACVYVDGTSLGCNNYGSGALSITNASALMTGQEQDSYGGTFAANQGLLAQLDEFKVFNGTLSAAQIASIRTNELAGNNYDGTARSNLCVAFNHLRIEHNGSGVTCAPTTLTLKACADALCTSLYSGGVTGTLTATGTPTVNWVGGANFAIGATGWVTKDVQVTTAGNLTWGASGVAPVATSGTTCYVGATNSCSYSSALAGFLFDVPHHASDTPQTITVSAVRQADNSLACTPVFASTTKTINFGCAYSNPASGTLPVVVGGSNIACGSTSGISLNFNASGVASTTVRYADVGQMSLTAGYTGSGGSEAGLVMTGSDTFIAAPASLLVTPTGPFVAGNNFSVTVAAKNASGNTTPNFGKESTTENVVLTHTLIGPAGGNNPALSGTTTLLDATFQSGNGVAATNSIAWAEVGDITLTATLASGSYLGSGLTATGSAAAGAFKPAYFDTVVTPGTGSFTYSGQPFTVQVSAKNSAGGTTLNYTGAYAKAVTLTDGNSGTNNSATLGTFSNAGIAAASFNNGVATTSTVSYRFNAKTTAPLEAPASAPLKLRATDTDGVTSNGHTEGTTPIRAGRLRLVNYYGSDLLKPRVEYRAEYWDGSRWATNTLDSSNPIVAGNVATGGLTVNGITALNNGIGFITFNTAAAGSYDIALDLNASGVDTSCNAAHGGTAANKPWLQGYWSAPANCGGVAAWAQDPNARVRLGSPRAPYIYLRERY